MNNEKHGQGTNTTKICADKSAKIFLPKLSDQAQKFGISMKKKASFCFCSPCLESIHKSFFSLSQPTSSFETILIKKVKYYSFKTFTRWNFENWKKQNKNSIPNIKLKPRLMICFWFLIEGVMPLLIYVLKPKRIHTVILEYFNMKMNKLFLILPSSLFRYSFGITFICIQDKNNFSNAMMRFWGLH